MARQGKPSGKFRLVDRAAELPVALAVLVVEAEEVVAVADEPVLDLLVGVRAVSDFAFQGLSRHFTASSRFLNDEIVLLMSSFS